MTLTELEATAEKVLVLERRISEIEQSLDKEKQGVELPAFVSLRTLCDYCGLSYSTMRKAEHRSELPGKGRPELTRGGRNLWRKETVLRWMQETDG